MLSLCPSCCPGLHTRESVHCCSRLFDICACIQYVTNAVIVLLGHRARIGYFIYFQSVKLWNPLWILAEIAENPCTIRRLLSNLYFSLVSDLASAYSSYIGTRCELHQRLW